MPLLLTARVGGGIASSALSDAALDCERRHVFICKVSASVPPGAPWAPNQAGSSAVAGPKVELTPDHYFAKMLPRHPSAPWSAPILDGVQVQAKPQIACMSSGEGTDTSGEQVQDGCSCYTEQGTIYAVEKSLCVSMARNGALCSPFRAPPGDRQASPAAASADPGAGQSPAAMDAQASVQAAGGGGQPYGTGAAYGDIGVR